jgi:HD-GYP domain-containing protein (c-di-GMP phosphodiesterase class II)
VIRVKSGELRIGMTLPWTVYDGAGRLLLREGCTLSSEHQVSVLIARGLYRQADDGQIEEADDILPKGRPPTPFELFYEFASRLDALFSQIEQKQGGCGRSLLKLCTDLQQLCASAPDAALGAVHLCNDGPYPVYHPLHVAVLCELVARRLKYPDEIRTDTVAAALTANVSMRDLQGKLHKQSSPLDEAQRAAIARHPDESARMLREAGVTNDRLLMLVGQHHELPDGSGYPQGRTRDAIAAETLVLGMAESYATMVSGRAYRKPLPAKDALRRFLLARGRQYDETLSQVFIKVLSVYPPGAFVKLENGETAVVIKRAGDDTLHPVVSSYMSQKGTLYTQPRHYDTRQPGFAIKEDCAPDYRVQTMMNMLWGYS